MEFPLGHRLRELPGPLLLTGHTGFKGTWMTFLLEHLNVPVVGYSLPAGKDSLYDRAERAGAIPEACEDIRDYQTLEEFIELHKPSTVIHMAAQPLVLQSYENPRETFDVNVMGTVNLLDIAFKKDFVEAIIVVTTDKVYRNDNSGRAFIEIDPLEGKDPYSASKVGAESVVAAWQQIARVSGGPRVAAVRAGNVIGGGDFAENRIIPDLIRGVITGIPVEIRNIESTRPWQHVLDASLGYLMLLEALCLGRSITSLNFAPNNLDISVGEIARIAKSYFPGLVTINSTADTSINGLEAKSLALNSEFARETLNWESIWDQRDAVNLTFSWWSDYFKNNLNARERCAIDIEKYLRHINS